MKFHKKNISLPDNGKSVSFKCHDYSTIIDADVYKGGYDTHYCNIYYTTPGDVDYSENKTISVLCINEIEFVDTSKSHYTSSTWEKPHIPIVVEDKYKFFKSVTIKYGNVSSRWFFFTHEELSVVENRDVKLEDQLGI